MRKTKLSIAIQIALIVMISCTEKTAENNHGVESEQADISVLKKEIELRIREYENYLQKGDSIGLGNMYTVDAEIIPSVVGRENIVKAFGAHIRNEITGSSFTTTHVWGNEQLLVEEGTGTWYYADGTPVGSGRYLLVWQKDDGEWKILRDTWFPDKKK